MWNDDNTRPCLPSPNESDSCHELLNVHGEYDLPDADLVLTSNDGQHFRVHSCIMRLASRVFNDMLDMPSPPGQRQGIDVDRLVPLQEREEVVKVLLDLVYPDRSFLGPEKLSFDLFRDLCIAADKYDMPRAQHILRMTFQLGVNCYPLIAGYVLASQLDWEQERQLFSNKTLGINLRSPESREQLRAINSSAVWDLLELHDRRRDILIKALDPESWRLLESDFKILSAKIRTHHYRWCQCRCCKSESTCSQCPSWTALIHRVSEHMENLSLGTSLRDCGFWDREEFKPIWELKCCECDKLISKEGLRHEVLRVLDNLPDTVKP